MATSYIEILALQRPAYYGTDDLGRVMYSMNFQASATWPIGDVVLEIAKVLIDAGLGTLFSGTTGNIFTSPKGIVPAGAGPYIIILATGGGRPVDYNAGGSIELVTFQITVRGDNSITTNTRALAIWRAVHGIRSQTLLPAA